MRESEAAEWPTGPRARFAKRPGRRAPSVRHDPFAGRHALRDRFRRVVECRQAKSLAPARGAFVEHGNAVQKTIDYAVGSAQ